MTDENKSVVDYGRELREAVANNRSDDIENAMRGVMRTARSHWCGERLIVPAVKGVLKSILAKPNGNFEGMDYDPQATDPATKCALILKLAKPIFQYTDRFLLVDITNIREDIEEAFFRQYLEINNVEQKIAIHRTIMNEATKDYSPFRSFSNKLLGIINRIDSQEASGYARSALTPA